MIDCPYCFRRRLNKDDIICPGCGTAFPGQKKELRLRFSIKEQIGWEVDRRSGKDISASIDIPLDDLKRRYKNYSTDELYAIYSGWAFYLEKRRERENRQQKLFAPLSVLIITILFIIGARFDFKPLYMSMGIILVLLNFSIILIDPGPQTCLGLATIVLVLFIKPWYLGLFWAASTSVFLSVPFWFVDAYKFFKGEKY